MQRRYVLEAGLDQIANLGHRLGKTANALMQPRNVYKMNLVSHVLLSV